MSQQPHDILSYGQPEQILLVTAVSSSALQLLPPESSSDCPICLKPLCAMDPSNFGAVHHDHEGAVRVDLVATCISSARLCGHTFGKQCLFEHLNSRAPWSRSCPMCRNDWDAPASTMPMTPEELESRSEAFIRHLKTEDGLWIIYANIDELEKHLQVFYAAQDTASGRKARDKEQEGGGSDIEQEHWKGA